MPPRDAIFRNCVLPQISLPRGEPFKLEAAHRRNEASAGQGSTGSKWLPGHEGPCLAGDGSWNSPSLHRTLARGPCTCNAESERCSCMPVGPGLVESPSLGDAAVSGIQRCVRIVFAASVPLPRNADTVGLAKVCAAGRASRLRGQCRGAVGDLRKVA